MQQQLFTLSGKEIIDPKIGDIIEIEGIRARCTAFDKSVDLQCDLCDFKPFPVSVCCGQVCCFGIERQDKTPIIFKI